MQCAHMKFVLGVSGEILILDPEPASRRGQFWPTALYGRKLRFMSNPPHRGKMGSKLVGANSNTLHATHEVNTTTAAVQRAKFPKIGPMTARCSPDKSRTLVLPPYNFRRRKCTKTNMLFTGHTGCIIWCSFNLGHCHIYVTFTFWSIGKLKFGKIRVGLYTVEISTVMTPRTPPLEFCVLQTFGKWNNMLMLFPSKTFADAFSLHTNAQTHARHVFQFGPH